MSPCNMPCGYRTGEGALYPFFLAALDGGGQSTPRLGGLTPTPPGKEAQYPFSTSRLQTLKQ